MEQVKDSVELRQGSMRLALQVVKLSLLSVDNTGGLYDTQSKDTEGQTMFK